MTDQEIQDKIQAHQKAKAKVVKPTVSVKEMIQKLDDWGYGTKITHYRYFGRRLLRNVDIRVLIRALKIMGNNVAEACKREGDFVNSRGGLTHVEVFHRGSINSIIYKAKAECSKQDNFEYSKASRLALYRALGQLPDEEAKNYKKELEKMYLKYVIQVKTNGKWVDNDYSNYRPVEDKETAEYMSASLYYETKLETRVMLVFE